MRGRTSNHVIQTCRPGITYCAFLLLLALVGIATAETTVGKAAIEAENSVTAPDLVVTSLNGFRPLLGWNGGAYDSLAKDREQREFVLAEISGGTRFTDEGIAELRSQVNVFLEELARQTDRGSLTANIRTEDDVLILTVSQAKRGWFRSLFGKRRATAPAGEPVDATASLSTQGTAAEVVAPTAAATTPALAQAPPPAAPGGDAETSQPTGEDGATDVESAPQAQTPPLAETEAVSATVEGALPTDGDSYPVSAFKPEYETGDETVPSIERMLAEVKVALLTTKDGLVAPRKSMPGETKSLGDLQGNFRGSAIRAVNAAIVRWLGAQGYVGVYAVPHQDDIAEDGSDAREGRSRLRLVVWLSRVGQVRTVGAGDRVKDGERVNLPHHSRIANNSPVEVGQLLTRNKVENYAELLSRHPGRQVDLSLGSGEELGEVVLDYIVTENKPWLGYINTSNSGTPSTDRIRHRAGFLLNQVTDRDDTLGIEYSTANFRASHAGNIFYETPIFSNKLRLRLEGGGGEFTASDVAIRDIDLNYEGESWTAGASANLNVLQHKGWFVDVSTGFNFRGISVEQELAGVLSDADATLFLPHVGLSLEKRSPLYTSRATAKLEWNVPGTHDNTEADLQGLGRLNPSKGWSILHYAIENQVFLDALWLRLLDRYDATKPAKFEMLTRLNGQYTEDNRLIPQAQRTVGGMNSVRGYTESVAAGDSATVFNLDFKLHLSKFLKPRANGTVTLPGNLPFKWAPSYDHDRPDWDLALRAFFDYAKIKNEEGAANNEVDHKLMSVGIGLDLGIKKHFTLSLDWGHALEEIIESGQVIVEDGDDRLHVSGTVVF